MSPKTVKFAISLSENTTHPVHVSYFKASASKKLSWHYISNTKKVLQRLACTNFLHYLKITKSSTSGKRYAGGACTSSSCA